MAAWRKKALQSLAGCMKPRPRATEGSDGLEAGSGEGRPGRLVASTRL